MFKRKSDIFDPLRVDTTWILDGTGKANAFAHAWNAKAKLPPDHADCLFIGTADHTIDFFMAFRTRYTLKLFKKLNVSKATGGDQISAMILRKLAPVLAATFT